MRIDTAFAGRHLAIDALVHDARPLDDMDYLNCVLEELVASLGMVIIAGPRFMRVTQSKLLLNSDDDEGGVTGFCIISTSHIAIHTWPLRKRFSMDIFSCKEFDAAKAVRFLKGKLGITSFVDHNLERSWPT